MHHPLLDDIHDINSFDYEYTSSLIDSTSNTTGSHRSSMRREAENGSSGSWRPPTPTNEGNTARFSKLMSSIGESISAVMDVDDHAEEQLTYYDESLLMDEEKGNVEDINSPNSSRNFQKNHVIANFPQRLGNDYHAVPHDNGAERVRNECILFYNDEDERVVAPRSESLVHSNVPREALDRSIASCSTNASVSTIYDVPIMKKGKTGNAKMFDTITINAEDFSSSYLYEIDHAGQVNYKLPTDNVRLAVIPNVQPGILSMVVDDASTQDTDTSTDTSKNSTDQKNGWRSVSYVLTVEDDLYRRLVQEMADSLQSPLGLYNCCRESGTVDIRIALAILAVFFMFLFITTLVWPTN